MPSLSAPPHRSGVRSLIFGLLLAASTSWGDPATPDVATEALRQVARASGVFHAPPVLMPTRKLPDGPLLGNGDLGVAIGAVTERLPLSGRELQPDIPDLVQGEPLTGRRGGRGTEGGNNRRKQAGEQKGDTAFHGRSK